MTIEITTKVTHSEIKTIIIDGSFDRKGILVVFQRWWNLFNHSQVLLSSFCHTTVHQLSCQLVESLATLLIFGGSQ